MFQDRLQQIDSQQREMLSNVKTTLEGLEQERLSLIGTFKKVPSLSLKGNLISASVEPHRGGQRKEHSP